MRTNSLGATPLVSIIMPVYNGAPYIKEALSSIMQQDYENKEIIINNDGSTDATQEIIDEFIHNNPQVKIESLKNTTNQGISATINGGIMAAQGKYLSILDHDDKWIDEYKLRNQVSFLENNPDYGILGTNSVINKQGTLKPHYLPQTDDEIRKKILGLCPFLHSSIMYNREILNHIGGYSEQYKCAVDYDVFLRMMKNTKGANLKDISTLYRVHETNISKRMNKEQMQNALKLGREHKNDFPNGTKNIIVKRMIIHNTVRVLNDIFGDDPIYIKIKAEAKKFCFKE